MLNILYDVHAYLDVGRFGNPMCSKWRPRYRPSGRPFGNWSHDRPHGRPFMDWAHGVYRCVEYISIEDSLPDFSQESHSVV